VNDELGICDERQELVGNIDEARLARKLSARDSVHSERGGVDVAFRIDITMKGAARGPAVHKLNAADFNDAVTEFGLKAGRLSVKHDLSHGARVYLRSASIA
jgi:hypothetical protein